jgi:hypothetical protein
MSRSQHAALMSSLALAISAGCGNVSSDSPSPDAEPDAAVDAAPDAVPEVARCAHDRPFARPVPVAGVAAGAWTGVRLSDDELTLYASGTLASGAQSDLFVARRKRREDAFDMTVATPPLMTSSPGDDRFPTVSADGKTLVFDSDLKDGRHLWIASRNSTAAEFAPAGRLQGDASSASADTDAFLTADGELWFASGRTGSRGSLDLYHMPRVADGFGKAVQEYELSSRDSDGLPTLSADRMTLYFNSSRDTGDGSPGDYNVWTAHRSTVNDGWPAPTLVKEVSSDRTDWPGWLSPDGCRLYLSSDRDGTLTLYVAERTP